MKVKCDYCDSWISDSDEVCPNCGGTNSNYKRSAEDVPKTIEELRVWAEKHNLPLDQMRTYIGENYHGPKAFGIYYDDRVGEYIVYKNKSDGTRAVRYHGSDEAYAVNELYMKMKERVAEQKAHMKKDRTSQQEMNHQDYLETIRNNSRRRTKNLLKMIIFSMVSCYALPVLLIGICTLSSIITDKFTLDMGYYTYNGEPYYRSSTRWYEWNDSSGDWDILLSIPDELDDNYEDYYVGNGYSYTEDYQNFYNTNAYVREQEEEASREASRQASRENSYYDDNDWDNDYDWDSGDDWDDSYDDWDSDW